MPSALNDAVTGLVVVTGPPGADESTGAKAVADRFDRWALVAGDDFFHFIVRDRKGDGSPSRDSLHEGVSSGVIPHDRTRVGAFAGPGAPVSVWIRREVVAVQQGGQVT